MAEEVTDNRWERLQRTVTMCRRCPRLVAWREDVARTKVARYADWTYWGRPVPSFGDPQGRLWIVGLAPAAHGANRTGRMFTGDRSGEWLYEALYRYGFANQPQSTHVGDGLALTDCLITASVRCAPPDNKPLPQEFDNCRPWIEAEMAMLPNVRVVLVLGQIALTTAWKLLGEGRRPPFSHGGEAPLPGGSVLLMSYHPSQQNTFTGKLTRPMWHAIFARARALLS